MKLFAISDLHLPGGMAKPMDIFGEHWWDHFLRIAEDWRSKVSCEDYVLIPGDISWAMTLNQAYGDLDTIGALPGQKIILRGNHDYWWTSVSRVRGALPYNMHALQNDACLLDKVLIAGTRGWRTPGNGDFEAEDRKIYLREIQRLELSLADARRKDRHLPIVAMLHFPPFNEWQDENGFTESFSRYGVVKVLYGHLHGKKSIAAAFQGDHAGIQYQLVSCDALDFRLAQVGIF